MIHFYRYRTKWLGHVGDWIYRYFLVDTFDETDKSTITDELEYSNEHEWGYSEHYRGIEVEFNVEPPKDWLKQTLKNINNNINSLQQAEKSILSYLDNME